MRSHLRSKRNDNQHGRMRIYTETRLIWKMIWKHLENTEKILGNDLSSVRLANQRIISYLSSKSSTKFNNLVLIWFLPTIASLKESLALRPQRSSLRSVWKHNKIIMEIIFYAQVIRWILCNIWQKITIFNRKLISLNKNAMEYISHCITHKLL